jgi:hypothetical protein
MLMPASRHKYGVTRERFRQLQDGFYKPFTKDRPFFNLVEDTQYKWLKPRMAVLWGSNKASRLKPDARASAKAAQKALADEQAVVLNFIEKALQVKDLDEVPHPPRVRLSD